MRLRPKVVFFDGGLSQPKRYVSRLAPFFLNAESDRMIDTLLPPGGFLIDDASLLLQHHTKAWQLIRFCMYGYLK